jgi:hypothetical protein
MTRANFPLLTFANHALSAMVFPAGELTHGDNIKIIYTHIIFTQRKIQRAINVQIGDAI